MHLHALLLQIAAILVVGGLLARVLRWVGQPRVIAEILAGIALGPSVLGVLSPEVMEWFFPAESLDVLGTLAQLGLVFFMFLVGLEFDPRLLQGRVRAAFAISLAGIVVPLITGIAVALYLPASLSRNGVPVISFALFVGVAMSVTAFPVLARILTERRLVHTPVGAISLAAAAVGDAAAWGLLTLVVGITTAGGLTSAGSTVGWGVAYAAVMWFVIRPWLGKVGPRQGHLVSVELISGATVLVVLSAFVTEWIGIHAIFGGFLLGAVMPRHGSLSTVLAERMEEFVTVVLLPLFFAYSGLRTRMTLLDGAEDWGLTLLLLTVATAGKFGGSALAARFSGLGLRESAAVGILMNTRGLMELVVLNVGLDLGLISERMFAMMVVVALVTTWMTTPILRRVYPMEQPRAEAPPPAPEESEPVGIMVCAADPQIAGALVELAAALVRGRAEPVWIVHLWPVDRLHEYLKLHEDDDDGPLAAVERAARRVGLAHEVVTYASAEPGEDLVGIAAEKGVRLVLLGTHRTAFGLESLGGVTGTILEGCDAAVGILHDRGLRRVSRIRIEAGGPHAGAVSEIGDQLAEGGAEIVDPSGGEVPDLNLVSYSRDIVLPSRPGGSVLLVRGPPRRADGRGPRV